MCFHSKTKYLASQFKSKKKYANGTRDACVSTCYPRLGSTQIV